MLSITQSFRIEILESCFTYFSSPSPYNQCLLDSSLLPSFKMSRVQFFLSISTITIWSSNPFSPNSPLTNLSLLTASLCCSHSKITVKKVFLNYYLNDISPPPPHTLKSKFPCWAHKTIYIIFKFYLFILIGWGTTPMINLPYFPAYQNLPLVLPSSGPPQRTFPLYPHSWFPLT